MADPAIFSSWEADFAEQIDTTIFHKEIAGGVGCNIALNRFAGYCFQDADFGTVKRFF
jgi:hypothetical protein